jgi:hypothetical protein
MHRRCTDPAYIYYKNYGGRGISVCSAWKDIWRFYSDMGNPPSNKHTLERIDNNEGYFKKNCRWATRHEQAKNRSDTTFCTINGVTKCIKDWTRHFNICPETVQFRIHKLGWEIKKAIVTPSKKRAVFLYKGKMYFLTDLAREFDLPLSLLHDRINRYGWGIERAITAPNRKYTKL